MTLIELASLARLTRNAQKAYFKVRRQGLQGSAELEQSKNFERALDAAINSVLDIQSPMLPGMGGEE